MAGKERTMIAYVFFAKEVAMPRFEALKQRASYWAKLARLEDPWCHHGNEYKALGFEDGYIAFGFEDGPGDDSGRWAASRFVYDCGCQNIPLKADWVG